MRPASAPPASLLPPSTLLLCSPHPPLSYLSSVFLIPPLPFHMVLTLTRVFLPSPSTLSSDLYLNQSYFAFSRYFYIVLTFPTVLLPSLTISYCLYITQSSSAPSPEINYTLSSFSSSSSSPPPSEGPWRRPWRESKSLAVLWCDVYQDGCPFKFPSASPSFQHVMSGGLCHHLPSHWDLRMSGQTASNTTSLPTGGSNMDSSLICFYSLFNLMKNGNLIFLNLTEKELFFFIDNLLAFCRFLDIIVMTPEAT